MSAGGGDAATIIVGDKSGYGWGSSKHRCVKLVRQGYVVRAVWVGGAMTVGIAWGNSEVKL